MDVDARVWIPDQVADLVWLSAKILSITSHHVTVQIDGCDQDADAAAFSSSTVSVSSNASSTTSTTSGWWGLSSLVSNLGIGSLSSGGRVFELPLQLNAQGECDNVLLQNPPDKQDQNDLVTLPHLHEASILNSLRVRYARDVIYTRIGDILVSVNPFKELHGVYCDQRIDQYAKALPHAFGDLPPHLYAIAKASFDDLCDNHRDQSILISGESGAGKTEATKIIMKYFASTCASQTTILPAVQADREQTSIECQVLQSNPILEAFGNARTVRNDNSSRFGKFIEIQLNAQHKIVGARIRTYLLEKIRVINQATNERNFHIFYELTKSVGGAKAREFMSQQLIQNHSHTFASSLDQCCAKWQLESPQQFDLLNQSGCYERQDGVDDIQQFGTTLQAMKAIGMTPQEIENVLDIVVAVLHLGNVRFDQVKSSTQLNMQEAVVDAATANHLEHASSLLQVESCRLVDAMTKRLLVTANETLVVGMDAAQALNTRNALVMECYRLLFEWLVARINCMICEHQSSHVTNVLALLDIFGFEDLATNSFEQMCINYANESLQNQFNEFVFEEEQKLYQREEIQWDFVDFPSNTLCLELFEKKPIGIFSLLDQECLFPQGTDRALLSKLYTEFLPTANTNGSAPRRNSKPNTVPNASSNKHFVTAGALLCQSHFVIHHYAGQVRYTVDGFLVKNKDYFCESASILLASSSNQLIKSLADHANHSTSMLSASSSGSFSSSGPRSAPTTSNPGLRRNKSAISAVSVCTQFKLQLGELLDTIRLTKPYYVRCIKPNDQNVADSLCCRRVVEQLRSGGVLEAVRVARAGFPVRMPHEEFLERYSGILFYNNTSSKTLEACLTRLFDSVLPAVDEGSNSSQDQDHPVKHKAARRRHHGVCVGKTMVFFKRQPYEMLEKYRYHVQVSTSIMLQKTWRGFRQYRRFHQFRNAVLALQSRCRGRLARRLVQMLREIRSATLLQRNVRCWQAKWRFTLMKRVVQWTQCAWRCKAARRISQDLRENRAIKILIRRIRLFLARRRFARWRNALVQLQCALRCKLARRQLVALRVESKNVAKLQNDNLQLKDELKELRLELLAMKAVMLSNAVELNEEEALSLKTDDSLVAQNDATSSSPQLENLHRLDSSNLADATQSIDLSTSPLKPTLQSPGTSPRATPLSLIEPVKLALPETVKIQQEQVEAQVRTLRDQLKHAATRPNSQQEQDLVVKKFVASQIKSKAATLRLPEPLHNGKDSMRAAPMTTTAAMARSGRTISSYPAPPSGRLSNADSLLATPKQRKFPLSTRGMFSFFSSGTKPNGESDDDQFGDFDRYSSASVRMRFSSFSGSVPRWVKDSRCKQCKCRFTWVTRRHHCRQCGHSFCYEHSTRKLNLPFLGYHEPVRVCDDCFEQNWIESDRSTMYSPSPCEEALDKPPLSPHAEEVDSTHAIETVNTATNTATTATAIATRPG